MARFTTQQPRGRRVITEPTPLAGDSRSRPSRLLLRDGLLRLVLLALVLRNVRAPWRRLDGARSLPYDVELAVGLHFANEHGLPQMMVLLVHLDGESVGGGEALSRHRDDHLVDVGALGLLD